MGILVAIIFIALIGGMVGMAVHQIHKTDINRTDSSNGSNIDSTQEFLPFTDISDSMVDMGNFSYRAIIECSSINYLLKTEGEQEVIELSYQRFLNGLTHPITIFIQTKKTNYAKILESFKQDADETLKVFPLLKDYAEDHYNFLKAQEGLEQCNKEKKKYIIVPFDEAIELTATSDEDKRKYARKELFTRCQIIIDSLSSIGLNCKVLNSREIVELFFSANNKSDSRLAEEVSSGLYNSLIIDGDNKLEKITSNDKLDWILKETQSRLQSEFLDSKQPEWMREQIADIIRDIESMRDEYAGSYKTFADSE